MLKAAIAQQVTDISAAEWCQQQMAYKLTVQLPDVRSCSHPIASGPPCAGVQRKLTHLILTALLAAVQHSSWQLLQSQSGGAAASRRKVLGLVSLTLMFLILGPQEDPQVLLDMLETRAMRAGTAHHAVLEAETAPEQVRRMSGSTA